MLRSALKQGCFKSRSNAMRRLVCIFLFIWSLPCFAVLSESVRTQYLNDLIASYTTNLGRFDTFKARVKTIRDGLPHFSDTDRQMIENQLMPIDDKISKAIASLNTINTEVKDTMIAAQTVPELQAALADAKKRMPLVPLNSYYSIDHLLRLVEDQFKRIELSAVEIAQKEAQVKKHEQQQKIMKLLGTVGKVIPVLQNTDKEMNIMLLKYGQTGLFDSKQMQNLIDQYKNALSITATAYSSGGFTPNFSDQTNFLASIMRRLINLVLKDISATINKADQVKQEALKAGKSKNQYYDYFYDLVQRLQGTEPETDSAIVALGFPKKGYGALVAQQAREYFSPNAKMVIDYYNEKKNSMSLGAFGDVLQDLAISVTAPSSYDIVHAYALYIELRDGAYILKMSNEANERVAKDITEKINTYMALLYVNRAQSLLQSMTLAMDTAQILTLIIDAFKNAATCYTNASDTTRAGLYKDMADKLSLGKSLRISGESAEGSNNITGAMIFYEQAYEQFIAAGDAIDAQQVRLKKNRLQVKEGQKNLIDFLDRYKTQFQSYMTYISSPDTQETVHLASYSTMLSSLIDTCTKTINAYNSVIVSTKSIGENVDLLNQATLVLQNMQQGFEKLSYGDSVAQFGSIDGLNQAHAIYGQAQRYFTVADKSYTEKVSEYVPLYPSLIVNAELQALVQGKQTWNLQTIAQRHAAKQYIEVANTLYDDLPIAVQYYIDADGARKMYLSNAVDSFLSTTLDTIASVSGLIDQIYRAAKAKETEALVLSSTDWQPQEGVEGYGSRAKTVWIDVLRQYYSALYLGKKEARQDYEQAISSYGQAYKTNVASKYYPLSGAALIYYRQYVLSVLGNKTEQRDTVLKMIEDLMSNYSAIVRESIAKVAQPDLLSSATENEEKIISWLDEFERILGEQQATIIEALALYPEQHDEQSSILFNKVVNATNGDITCSMQPFGQKATFSITIPNPDVKFADLYKKIADDFFASKNYAQAYPNYHQAQTYYQKAGKTYQAQQAKNNGDLSYIRALVRLVIPNERDKHALETVMVSGVSVPEHYELYNYYLQLPSYISLPITLQEIAQNPTQEALARFEDTLKLYAYLLYADNILNGYNISFDKVFSNDLQLLPEPVVAEFQKPLVIKALAQANVFETTLQKRLNKKQSSLRLSAQKTETGTSYYLSIFYMPIFSVIPLSETALTPLPYTKFPTAFEYYSYAQKLSENDVSFSSLMQENIAKAYLSAVALQKKRVDYLLNGGDAATIDPTTGAEELTNLQAARKKIEALRQVKKDNMSVKLNEYISAFYMIRSYIKDVSVQYWSDAYDYYKKDASIAQRLNTLLSDLYEQLGDAAQLFLVGDPLSADYYVANIPSDPSSLNAGNFTSSSSGLLRELLYYYMLAYAVVPDRQDVLVQKATMAYVNAGDLVFNQGKYFGSLPYYRVGSVLALQTTKKSMQDSAALKLLTALFKGSTNNMVAYRAAMVKPLEITLTTGKKIDISLDELVNKITTCPMPETDQAECDVWEDLRAKILDACIFYMDCIAYANIFANPQIVSSNQQSSTQDSSELEKHALDLISSYTKDNAISFDNLSSVTTFIKRDTFESLVMGGFNLWSEKILKATNDNDRALGFMAIKEWSSKLFFAFAQLYIYHYSSNVTFTTENPLLDFFQSLSRERQAIIAPAEEWLGK
jgi:hypothetical protein